MEQCNYEESIRANPEILFSLGRPSPYIAAKQWEVSLHTYINFSMQSMDQAQNIGHKD